MLIKKNKYILLLAALIVSSVFGLESVQAEDKGRVFEMRTYFANEGKLKELN